MYTFEVSTDPRWVTATGLIEDGNFQDGSDRTTWTASMSAEDADRLADDLVTRHDGMRLYPTSGDLEPLDGREVPVTMIGSNWWWDKPELQLVVQYPNGHSLQLTLFQTVSFLTPAEAELAAVRLREAAGELHGAAKIAEGGTP